ncbi:MAG: hypothetical protein K0B07_01230 [DPANN group archaeon]|nr:hypothetical protein [DPANN group archaeon]
MSGLLDCKKNTKNIIFTIKDEAFLEGIFDNGITDVLKENYADYESKIAQNGKTYTGLLFRIFKMDTFQSSTNILFI